MVKTSHFGRCVRSCRVGAVLRERDLTHFARIGLTMYTEVIAPPLKSIVKFHFIKKRKHSLSTLRHFQSLRVCLFVIHSDHNLEAFLSA